MLDRKASRCQFFVASLRRRVQQIFKLPCALASSAFRRVVTIVSGKGRSGGISVGSSANSGPGRGDRNTSISVHQLHSSEPTGYPTRG